MTSQPDPVDNAPSAEVSLEAAEAQYRQAIVAYNQLLEKGMSWLFDVGSWVFGGLIAFTLYIIAALITIGPVDLYIKLATVALALALPLDVTGLVLLRLAQDIQPGKFEQEIAKSFEDAGLTPGEQQIPSLTALKAMRIRGTRVAQRVAAGILALSALLTVAGTTAALWHMAWWIGAAFIAMVLASLALALIVMAVIQPSVSADEKARRKRNRDELIRQAKERAQQEKARAQQAIRRR